MKKEEIKERLQEARSLKWFHRFEVIKGSGIYTPGWVEVSDNGYDKKFSHLKLPPDFFKGKRVLDIGTSTGALAFYFEDLGAKVVAIDICEQEDRGFGIVHEIRESKVEFRRTPVYDLNPEDFGYFDVIAFFGVYYHLKHPVLAFERINSVCKPGAILVGGGTTCDRWYHDEDESCGNGANFDLLTEDLINNKKILNIKNVNELPLCGFSAGQFFRDSSNWFIPNSKCVLNWLKTSGFKVEVSFTNFWPLKRDWNKIKIFTSGIEFKAIKVDSPIPENMDLRNHKIPTSFELERALKEIEQLKQRLREYEK